ncbi:hypothetical protein [Dyadobacter bucti]|uniref:hypothetical protein n=1 Tax=Dyadobacter bucti TaxID=2572203 RepID=UPI003F6F971A
MKTSEDKLNEALRAALKRKFDNFEAAPEPSSFEKIMAQLKPARNWKYLFFTILFVSVFIAGIKLDQHMLRQKNTAGIQNGAKIMAPHVGKKQMAPARSGVDADKKLTEYVSLKKSLRNTAETGIIRKREPEQTGGSAAQHVYRVNMKNGFAGFDTPKPPFGVSASEEQPGEVHATGDEAVLSPWLVTPEMLAGQPAVFASASPELPLVRFAGDVEKYKLLNTKPTRMSFLLHVAASQGYQILTVPSSVGQSFQNFAFPSTFSRQSLGYKFSGGVEKNGFQLMLHYSGFKQSYSYEIAGSDYIVEPVDKDNYKIVRQGEQISETRKYRLLGIGISKEVRWGRSQFSKYFVKAGLEYSQSLDSRQRIGWVSIGAGKQFAIADQMLLNLGPYAEFSPGKISSERTPFFYQPYRLGVSLGVKLVRP